MKITISGLGVMGASLALTLKRNLANVTVFGFDLPEILEEAQTKKIIDKRIEQWPQECHGSDIIFLATPIRVIKRHLQDLVQVVDTGTIVTDLGSTKAEIVEFARSLEFPGLFIGGHPMTGSEKSGLGAANPLLYENAVYILTPQSKTIHPSVRDKLLTTLAAIKARVLLLDPVTHDQIIAAISHLPQLIAMALVNLVGAKQAEDKPYFDLAAGGFRDLTRIASSPVNTWGDIFSSNEKNIQQILDEFIHLLRRYKIDFKTLSSELKRANEYRNQLPPKTKGFLSPLTDVIVHVDDQVGVIARISTALAAKTINIRDIELLKIREREGGVFRFSFASMDHAKQALEILESFNYQAFIRE